MELKKHIIDTIKEWQLKIGYREGNMKLYYPGESLEALLGIVGESVSKEKLVNALETFCNETEPQLGRIKITGSYERYCLDIPAKGSAYVASKVPEPEFLKLFLQTITGVGATMEKVRECFAVYASEHGTSFVGEVPREHETSNEHHAHAHTGQAFYFEDNTVDEYVYWVEENEFGLTYHRFTKADYEKLK